MALQLLISFVYELVRQSWFFAAFIVKFVIAAVAFKLAYEKRLEFESFEEELLEYSRETVTGIVVVGLALTFTGLQLPLYFQLFSEVVALMYFGFLFWKF